MQPITLDNQQAAMPHLQDSFVDLQMSSTHESYGCQDDQLQCLLSQMQYEST